MPPTDSPQTGYAPVNGLQLYYEVRGTGDPLVLLHGGVAGIVMFGPNLQELSRDRRLVAVELQGHGRTRDIDRPLSYEVMADDVAALLGHLDIARADVMGLSLGAGVALQMAFRHARLVRKLVVVSAPCRRDGWYPEVRARFDRMDAAAAGPMRQSPLAQLYPDIDWGRLFAKIGDLQRREYDWSAQVQALEVPTMLVFAEADAVRAAHIVEFFGLLGGGHRDAGLDGEGRPVAQLAVLPGLTHYQIGSDPALAAAALPFLRAPMPDTR